MSEGVKNLRLFFAREREAKKGLKGSVVGSCEGLTGFNKRRKRGILSPTILNY